MHAYRIGGLVLAANGSMPALDAVRLETSASADVTVRFDAPEPVEEEGEAFLSVPAQDAGHPWLTCAKTSGGYRLDFPGLVRFSVNGDGTEVGVHAGPEIPAETAWHLLLDHVMPLVLNLRGCHVLHAAVVADTRGACAFIGPTGAGKSTLAAALSRSGFAVLTDDCATVRVHEASAAIEGLYPGIRLWEDTLAAMGEDGSILPVVAHYTAKRRWPGPWSAVGATSLSRIYVLERAPSVCTPCIMPFSRRDAVLAIVQALFHFDVTDGRMLEREFAFAEQLVATIPVARLQIPDDLAAVPLVSSTLATDFNHANVSVLR